MSVLPRPHAWQFSTRFAATETISDLGDQYSPSSTVAVVHTYVSNGTPFRIDVRDRKPTKLASNMMSSELMRREYDFADMEGRKNPHAKRLHEASHPASGRGRDRVLQGPGR